VRFQAFFLALVFLFRRRVHLSTPINAPACNPLFAPLKSILSNFSRTASIATVGHTFCPQEPLTHICILSKPRTSLDATPQWLRIGELRKSFHACYRLQSFRFVDIKSPARFQTCKLSFYFLAPGSLVNHVRPPVCVENATALNIGGGGRVNPNAGDRRAATNAARDDS